MKKKKKQFNPYDPIIAVIGIDHVYEGELYGLSHAQAEKQYFENLSNSDEVDDYEL